MNNIESYIVLNRKTGFIINLFISVSIIIFISLIVVAQVKYQKYYQVIGQVEKENEKSRLSLFVPLPKLKIIKNNKNLIIDKEKYVYNIACISDEYIISNDKKQYLKVVLDIDLKEEDKIVNNILEVKFLEKSQKIIYYLKEYLKKE